MKELTDNDELQDYSVITKTNIINDYKGKNIATSDNDDFCNVRRNLGLFYDGENYKTVGFCGCCYLKDIYGNYILDDKGDKVILNIPKSRFSEDSEDCILKMLNKIMTDDEFDQYFSNDLKEGKRLITYFFDEDLILAKSTIDEYKILTYISFIRLVLDFTRRGLMSKSIRKTQNFTGKIDIKNQITKNVMRGRDDRQYCKYSEKSVDIMENQVIKYALNIVIKDSKSLGLNNKEIIKELKSVMTGDLEKDTESLDSIIEKFEGSKEDKNALYTIGLLISEAVPFAEKEKLVQSFEKEVPRVNEELDKIANSIGNGDYDIALSLAEKLIEEGEDYINDGTYKENSKMVFFSFEESMQEALYRSLHRKERREIYAVPFPYATIYFMYGTILWNLEELEEAQTAFEKARKWNPVSASITLQYAETLSINGNISGKKCLKLIKEVFKYTFEPSELAYVYRTLGKFFSENELWKEAYICYNTSLKYDDNSGDAYNELEFIQDESGITENDISFGDEMKFTNNYGISLKPNQKIIKLAVDYGEEAYAEEDFEMAKYFLDIDYNLSPKAEIKSLLDKIEKELNS